MSTRREQNPLARMARNIGCCGCTWFMRSRQVVSDAPHPYGKCVVDPPRTGGKGPWPMVMETDYCGAWEPVDRVEV